MSPDRTPTRAQYIQGATRRGSVPVAGPAPRTIRPHQDPAWAGPASARHCVPSSRILSPTDRPWTVDLTASGSGQAVLRRPWTPASRSPGVMLQPHRQGCSPVAPFTATVLRHGGAAQSAARRGADAQADRGGRRPRARSRVGPPSSPTRTHLPRPLPAPSGSAADNALRPRCAPVRPARSGRADAGLRSLGVCEQVHTGSALTRVGRYPQLPSVGQIIRQGTDRPTGRRGAPVYCCNRISPLIPGSVRRVPPVAD